MPAHLSFARRIHGDLFANYSLTTPYPTISEYSGLSLPPYIWRDFSSLPSFKSILQHFSGDYESPVDYVHMKRMHLQDSVPDRDITLHVSANNPAMVCRTCGAKVNNLKILYQEFGFKAEEYIVGFYNQYLPPNSTECKNALFIRLRKDPSISK
ncbi:Cysteine-rich protein 2-binding protein [Phlyctochytrium planicorne]|nr:Cysteine-rich protein 2-binding protein [Phlyctochytrium planicorne]